MGVFTIYFIVMTGLYLVYMTVVITMDLFGKKVQNKNDIEEFNTSDDKDEVDETAHFVNETDGGYSIGQDDNDSSGDEMPDNQAEVSSLVDPAVTQTEEQIDNSPTDEDLLQEEMMESQADYERVKSVQDKMTSVTPFYQEQYTSEDFAFTLAQPMDKATKIFKQIVTV